MSLRFLCKASFLSSLVSVFLFVVACPGCYSLSGLNTYIRTGIDYSKIKKAAVFPFYNNTQAAEASSIVTEAFIAGLFEKKGFKMEFPGNVRSFLVNERIIVRTGVDLQTMDRMAKRLGVDAVILGEVDEYIGVEDRNKAVIPVVCIRSRMVDSRSGKILWMALHRRTGNDYIRVLDFGKVRSVAALTQKVVGEMIETMP
jgi:TolB-like protein